MKSVIEYITEAASMKFVSLGLPSGTRWATCNLGASKPEEVGDYFAWGETEPKDTFNKDNYKLREGRELTKYTREDKLKQLENEDDAAYVITKGKGVIPTSEQLRELRENTDIEWTDDYNNSKIAGFIIKAKNNKNHIFIPCNKHKKDSKEFYAAKNMPTTFGVWTSEITASGYGNTMIGVYREGTNLSRQELYISWDDNLREEGFPIRPVKNK